MNVNQDLLGKTITGVIATRSADSGLRQIWMLQFADGSHVEFVSPGARKALRQAASQRRTHNNGAKGFRVAIDDSEKLAEQTSDLPNRRQTKRPVQLANNHSLRYRQDPEAGAQLTLNVA
jgi:hypothetical protein